MAKQRKHKTRVELPKRPGTKYVKRYRTVEGELEYEYPKEKQKSRKGKRSDDANRKKSDLELWKEWKDTKNPNILDELYSRFEPLIHAQANTFLMSGLYLPPHTIEAEFYKKFVHALETYDPSKKTALATHIYAQLLAAKRFVSTYQNIGRIPENRIFDIGKYQRAESLLQAQLGRPPTREELAKYLGWKISDIVKMQKSLARDVSSSKLPINPFIYAPRLRSAIEIAKNELQEFDRKVLVRLLQGKSGVTIAKELGSNPTAVTRAKQRIVEHIQKQIGE